MNLLVRFILSCCAVGMLAGCEDARFGAREAGALGGAVLGAGLGAILGDQVGNTGEGIAIGAGVGALAGGVLGNEQDKADAEGERRQLTLDEQERQIEQNRRMIEELRSKGADARLTDRGVVVNLPDVLFEFGKSSLTQSARATIREIAKVADQYRDRNLSVEGHTDSVGTIEFNQRLSEDRARSAADELVRNGVIKRRIAIEGFGELDPIASNSSDSGRARNRRVEVVIENR